MMRWFFVLLVVLAPGRADAAMMVHYDLAGLVLQSDAVVVADRVGPVPVAAGATPLTRYRVVRTLRGTLAQGVEVDVYDQIFNTRGHTIDARVVVFLESSRGTRQIVPSGLRVVEAGKVFRFEQHDNPGPYVMVPQNKDPQDNWGAGGAQLDLAGLELAIAGAAKRVDALAAARSEQDPAKRRAAVLALFTAGAKASSSSGFYLDQLAHDARSMLASLGDLEGALLVELRDRSAAGLHGDYASLADLLAIARDAARGVELRASAITVAARHNQLYRDGAAIRALIALTGDPSPRVRAAAVEAAARPAHVTTGDPAEQRKLNALVAEARTAIAKRYELERDPAVLFAILAAFDRSFRKPVPARAGEPAAIARARVDENYINVIVRCLRPVRAKGGKVIATSNGKSVVIDAYNVAIQCPTSTGTGTSSPNRIAPGRYELAVELATTPPTKLPIGTLVVDARHEMVLTPP